MLLAMLTVWSFSLYSGPSFQSKGFVISLSPCSVASVGMPLVIIVGPSVHSWVRLLIDFSSLLEDIATLSTLEGGQQGGASR